MDITHYDPCLVENYFLFSQGYIEWREAAKKTWMKRRKKDGYRMIRHLCASTFFLSHISKILSETCQHCHTNFAARQSEKERRKLISHSRQGKQSQAKKEKQTAVRWWQYTNQSSVQKIRPAAINGLSHRGKGLDTPVLPYTMVLVDFNCLFSPPSLKSPPRVEKAVSRGHRGHKDYHRPKFFLLATWTPHSWI